MVRAGARSFSFVHAADLHLDTPFSGVHEVAPAVAVALREASLAAFDAIVALAIERAAAFVLIAGDVYDGAERGLRAQLRFRDGLARLSASSIATFVVHGNHDPVATGWSAIGDDWPEGVTVFGTGSPEVIDVQRDGLRIATVQGVSYATAATSENLARRLVRPPGDGLHIGLLHCNVAGASDAHANYSPCTLEDLRATGLDYLALGHVHERRVLSGGDGSPWVVYPGNTQARSPRRTEHGAKGAVVVHVSDSVVREVEFVACDAVRFETIECPLDGLGDLGELVDQLHDLARTRLGDCDGRSLVVRATLVGTSALHQDLQRPGSLEDMLTHLRERDPARTPFVWWDAIGDETSPPVDLAEIRRRGDFASDLLALGEGLGADAAAERALLERLIGEAPRAFAPRLRALIASPEQAAALGAAATRVALDELTGAGE